MASLNEVFPGFKGMAFDPLDDIKKQIKEEIKQKRLKSYPISYPQSSKEELKELDNYSPAILPQKMEHFYQSNFPSICEEYKAHLLSCKSCKKSGSSKTLENIIYFLSLIILLLLITLIIIISK